LLANEGKQSTTDLRMRVGKAREQANSTPNDEGFAT
jgi:hypothetical protein